jgi:hypothetical protein
VIFEKAELAETKQRVAAGGSISLLSRAPELGWNGCRTYCFVNVSGLGNI